jgi:tetraacyldisaccharide 4'-kinase
VSAAIASRGKPVMSAQIIADKTSIAALTGRRVLAFAGIGDPGRFFRTLRSHGIDVVRERIFADHHPFSKTDIDGLIADAARDGLALVTTEKDLARLRGREGLPDQVRMVPFKVTLRFDDEAPVRALIAAKLAQARDRKFFKPI